MTYQPCRKSGKRGRIAQGTWKKNGYVEAGSGLSPGHRVRVQPGTVDVREKSRAGSSLKERTLGSECNIYH